MQIRKLKNQGGINLMVKLFKTSCQIKIKNLFHGLFGLVSELCQEMTAPN